MSHFASHIEDIRINFTTYIGGIRPKWIKNFKSSKGIIIAGIIPSCWKHLIDEEFPIRVPELGVRRIRPYQGKRGYLSTIWYDENEEMLVLVHPDQDVPLGYLSIKIYVPLGDEPITHPNRNIAMEILNKLDRSQIEMIKITNHVAPKGDLQVVNDGNRVILKTDNPLLGPAGGFITYFNLSCEDHSYSDEGGKIIIKNLMKYDPTRSAESTID